MTPKIGYETLRHLANLAKIKLTKNEEEKLLIDLQKIIDHFNELNEVETSNIPPMNGGTNLKNVFRKDEVQNPYHQKGKESFPKTQDEFLEVPKVL